MRAVDNAESVSIYSMVSRCITIIISRYITEFSKPHLPWPNSYINYNSNQYTYICFKVIKAGNSKAKVSTVLVFT